MRHAGVRPKHLAEYLLPNPQPDLHHERQGDRVAAHRDERVEEDEHEHNARRPELISVAHTEEDVGDTARRGSPAYDLHELPAAKVAFAGWANEQQIDHISVEVLPARVAEYVEARDAQPVKDVRWAHVAERRAGEEGDR